jgi:hypothetical protein
MGPRPQAPSMAKGPGLQPADAPAYSRLTPRPTAG